ncbi:phosphate ABC transporter substrate-binding protein [Paenibacillus sp. J22TS3]|uniref:phosphate ABC transporter substrate-binding protein n=1 Tax=Paenibacillus sp. J22TS3 TaxID=2807192 RepID=UPI001B272693|nr:phosphate ABC transporter substrate-binding protein [Paenibacillus sp. J22TS3]GIP22664.1 phosphate-binding protein [Paenibacillus sp. J22TS3]
MKLKKSFLLTLTLAFAVSLAACGNKDNSSGSSTTDTTNKPTSETTALSGSILASGSTALQPLVEQVGKKFMDKNTGVSIQVQGGGSGTGLTQVSGGQVQIGNSDVFASEKMKDEAAAKELVDHQVAVVAIAAVTNPEVGVTNLTKQQLVDIFTGKITNWKDVGGKDQAIVIVNRPSSSGTRATFEKFALGTKTEDLKGSIQEDSSGTVKKLVTETPGAIGYLALSYLDDKVKAVQYEGVDATVDNVVSGKYPVWAYEHMYTKGEPDATTKAFLDYFMTDEVQNGDVVELGYIPANKMQVKRDEAGNVTK